METITDEEMIQIIDPNSTLNDIKEKLKTLKINGKQITWEEVKEILIKKIEKKLKYKIKKSKIVNADEKRHTANLKMRIRKKLKKQRIKMRGYE